MGKFSWQPTSLDKSHEADDVCKLTIVEASLVTIRIQKVSTSGVELAALAVNSLFDEWKKQSRILSSTVHNFDRAITSCNIYIYILYGKTFFAFRFLNQKLKYPFLEGHPVPFYMEGATPPPPPPSFIPRRGYQVIVVVVKGGNYVTNASFHSKEDRMFGIH